MYMPSLYVCIYIYIKIYIYIRIYNVLKCQAQFLGNILRQVAPSWHVLPVVLPVLPVVLPVLPVLPVPEIV